jgi:hypothetical protein
LLVSAGGWYEGVVNFDGVKKHLQLIDANGNGAFNDIAADPYQSDRVQIEGDQPPERYLGRMLEVDGKFFRVDVARDGAFVKVQKVENATLGRVLAPTNISEISLYGENGHFVRKPVHGEFTVPEGHYQIVEWTINRRDEKGAAWTLTGSAFPKSAGFDVTAGAAKTLEIGEPVQAVLGVTQTADRQDVFSLRFEGRQKEAIQMLREGQRPAGPKLTLARADGTVCYSNSFEFG